MLDSYNSAIAPGTAANRRRQAEEYIKFSIRYNVPYLAPSVTNSCMFAQHLANIHAAPTSIKNYISGAKTWISHHSGTTEAFLSPQFNQLVKGLTKNSGHVPSRAAPLAPHHVRAICDFADLSSSVPLAVRPAILIGYACFLRGSNLLSPSMQEWGGPHTLLAGDIRLTQSGLQIFLRSTKTRSDPRGLTFFIPATLDDPYCPVSAWRKYSGLIRPWALGPAFIQANRLPLTTRQLVVVMRLALQRHTDISAPKVSMHSLRRGAAQAAADAGLPLAEIKDRGTWKSNAGIRPYLSPHSCDVPTVPVSNLAN